jgi:integrase
MSVADRWHLSHPPKDAKRCSQHRKVPSAEHGTGLRWQVRNHFDAEGKPVPKENFEFEQDAKDKDAELKVAVKSGLYIDERAGKVTLRSRCELRQASRDNDPVTDQREESMLRNHVYEDPEHPGRTPKGGVAIGELPIGLLSRQPSRIAAWLAALPLHVNTKLLMWDLISPVFDAAVADHIIAENPFKSKAVTKPPHVDRPVVAWDAETMVKVADGLPERWRPMPLLAAACGHRQGEAFAVAKHDIDWLRRTVRVEVQVKIVGNRAVFAPIKNDEVRTVPVSSPVLNRLTEHLRDDGHKPVMVTLPWSDPGDKRDGKPVTRELLFTRDGGEVMSRHHFNPYWRAAWKAAGIEEAEQINGFHVCRHSAAAAWLSNGLNIAKVAAFLGDSVAVVSKTYAHFLPGDDDRARQIMDDHFALLAGRPAERANALIVPSEGGR